MMFFTLLFSGLLSLSSALSHLYHFVNETKTWTEAQTYCRTNYTDLATLYDTDDVNAVNQLGNPTGSAWIGLYEDVQNSWRWSITNSSFYGPGQTTFRNWATGEPNNINGEEFCVQMNSLGTWNDITCNNNHTVVCYGVGGTYTLVSNLSVTFSEAQTYCRINFIDLPSIRNLSENEAVRVAAAGNDIYIGLYRIRMWSDSSDSSFRNWKSGQPDYDFDETQCTAVSFDDSGQWIDEECTQTYPFFCYTAYVSGLRVVVDSATDLTEAEIENTVLKPLREELIQKGLPNSTNLSLRRVYKIDP